jgi:hypothetical protein
MVHHHYAATDTTSSVQWFIAKNKIALFPNLYSLNLAPCIFSLFQKMKLKPKGKGFNDVLEIQ